MDKILNITSTVRLSNGQLMPVFGIGTFNMPSNEVCKAAVLEALRVGYRHIDTAHAYNDERGVGEAIRESGVPRNEIWVTSKLWPSDYPDSLTAIDKMLQRLGLDYLDLLYVHQPVGEIKAAWKGMEEAVRQGKVRTLGISDFDWHQKEVEELFHYVCHEAEIKPAVMQIEFHPYAQREEWRSLMAENGIQLEGWFPLGGGLLPRQTLREDPVILDIAASHGKTAAQVILRWHLQMGASTVPGSKDPEHIRENADIFGFCLSEEEMNRIGALNKEKRFYESDYEQLKNFVSGWGVKD